MHLQPLERFARSERMLVEYILCDDSIDDFLRQRFEFFRSGPHDPHEAAPDSRPVFARLTLSQLPVYCPACKTVVNISLG
jgi:hypothetical protein